MGVFDEQECLGHYSEDDYECSVCNERVQCRLQTRKIHGIPPHRPATTIGRAPFTTTRPMPSQRQHDQSVEQRAYEKLGYAVAPPVEFRRVAVLPKEGETLFQRLMKNMLAGGLSAAGEEMAAYFRWNKF